MSSFKATVLNELITQLITVNITRVPCSGRTVVNGAGVSPASLASFVARQSGRQLPVVPKRPERNSRSALQQASATVDSQFDRNGSTVIGQNSNTAANNLQAPSATGGDARRRQTPSPQPALQAATTASSSTAQSSQANVREAVTSRLRAAAVSVSLSPPVVQPSAPIPELAYVSSQPLDDEMPPPPYATAIASAPPPLQIPRTHALRQQSMEGAPAPITATVRQQGRRARRPTSEPPRRSRKDQQRRQAPVRSPDVFTNDAPPAGITAAGARPKYPAASQAATTNGGDGPLVDVPLFVNNNSRPSDAATRHSSLIIDSPIILGEQRPILDVDYVKHVTLSAYLGNQLTKSLVYFNHKRPARLQVI